MTSSRSERIGGKTRPDNDDRLTGAQSKEDLKLKGIFDGGPSPDATSLVTSDDGSPLLSERQGDVISANRALMTLAKGFVGTGCLSLPYAWKEGGLWIFKTYFNFTMSNTIYSLILVVPLTAVNMIATMRMLSYLAITATLLWLFGAVCMLQQCIQLPSQWDQVPAYTNFWSTVMFFGTAMYSYEGQTMILPIENKMRFPEEFTENCGVLPTLMILITVFYTALGFYGYTAFGDKTLGTLPLNMPDTPLFTVVAIALTIMAFLAHPVNLYVVFDMFWSGFKRKTGNRFPFWFERPQLLSFLFRSFWVIVTFLIVVFVPRIEQIVSLVGITGGSLCAFVYPPILEMLTFRKVWAVKKSRRFIVSKVSFNIFLIFLGIFLCVTGLYINLITMYKTIGT